VNLLFVNYGDFTTNSLNHIAGFANTLSAQGHACVVAVTDKKASVSTVRHPHFVPATYAELLSKPACFPDGRGADLIHAWTPREGVRKFVLAYQRLLPAPARLVVHLEDNEEYLISSYAGLPIEALRGKLVSELPFELVDGLPHPTRYKTLLRLADGITVIVDRLRDFVPAGTPTQLLPPGVDFELYRPQDPDATLRRELGLRDTDKVVVFTGSVTYANAAEMRELYLAIKLLNERGVPTKLIRTGFTLPDFNTSFGFDPAGFVIDLGFVDKARLPQLLALADALVQPGHPGAFNDYRLPSKLPEFLASGRPVVLPASNIATQLVDGRDALVLKTGAPAEIADACQRLFADTALAARLGENGAAFARKTFDLGTNTAALSEFYRDLCSRPAVTDWTRFDGQPESDLTLVAARLKDRLATAVIPADLSALAAELDDLTLGARQLAEDLRLEKTHHANRRHEISELQKQLVNYEPAMRRAAALEQAETLYQSARKQLHAMERELGRSEAVRKQLVRLYDRAVELLKQAEQDRPRLLALEDKLKRMQGSFSWQVTSPLRALRRLLFDGKKKNASASPTSPDAFSQAVATLTRPGFHAHLDSPRNWNRARGSTVTIRGWCFSDKPTVYKKIRARLGSRQLEGRYGLERLDVSSRHPELPHAAYCGFKIEALIKPDDETLYLELCDEEGVWHVCLEQSLRHDSASEAVKGSYSHWVEQFDTFSPEALRALQAKADALQPRPLISILMPVFNPPERWLVDAIESVRAQAYAHWELCIADDASTQPHVRTVLTKYQKNDARIKVIFREKNGHISAATNSALELATGEFTALFDHDDRLAPHALYCFALELNAHPNAEVIYSDEDKIDEQGCRYDPHFKPAWNPDLFTTQNYLSHLTAYRTTALRTVGGLREGFEGSQDWDLALRVVERVPAESIRHIPRVLYHWRSVEGSTALHLGEKDYAGEAARRALGEYFARQNKGTVELSRARGGHWHVQRARSGPPPLVTLVIPTRNRRELLIACVESILAKTAYPNFEFLIADNDSDDPALQAFYEKMKARGRFEVLPCPGPFNYSAINNRAVRHARGEIVGLLNNDLEALATDWLDEMVSHASRPEIGCVGAKLHYPGRRIQHAGVITGLGGVAGHAFKNLPDDQPGTPQFRPHVVQNLSAVTAACLLVRKAVYLEAGGLDEEHLKVAFNDVDFCLKVQSLGYRNLYTPHAEFIHHESASRGAETTPEKIQRFQGEIATMKQRWGPRLLADPAYSPNFTLDSEDFALAYPPRTTAL
jgi:O-antigen biosynthesis protein